MGKTEIVIKLVTLRPDGAGGFRPRYIPGVKHRKLGLKGEDLRHADGTWFTLDECLAWSRDRTALIAELEQSTPRERRSLVRRSAGVSVGALFEQWFLEPRMNGKAQVEGKKERRPLASTTVDYYRTGSDRIRELDDGLVWNSPARAITAAMVGDEDKGILHRVEVARGLHVAICVRATLSAFYTWAKRKRHVGHNPAKGLDYSLPSPAPRIRVGSIDEMNHLVAAADLLMRDTKSGYGPVSCVDIGDSIVLGLWTGQRQADRLALEDPKVTPDGIIFQQRKKHGQPLLIPPAPPLAARLRAAKLRRRDWKVNYPHVVLDEGSRRPFDRHWYKKLFALVRQAAAFGILDDGTVPEVAIEPRLVDRYQWKLRPMPSLADFHDQDLRDTAVTWLALAECTKAEIAAITGHSLASIDDVLKHYLGLHPELARSAIGKLVKWHEQQQGEGA